MILIEVYGLDIKENAWIIPFIVYSHANFDQKRQLHHVKRGETNFT